MKYYYHTEKRHCLECGKRSIKRAYGRIIGNLFFSVIRYVHGGKTIDSHKCPHCGHQHKVAFGKAKDTFPLVSRGMSYKEVSEGTAKGEPGKLVATDAGGK